MTVQLAEQVPAEAIAVRVPAATWEEAITAAGDLLVACDVTVEGYTQQMIDTVTQLGPYIVVAPGLALAHARPSPVTVKKPGISIVTLAEPVDFGSGPHDPVTVIIGLAAPTTNAHLQLMGALAEVLSNPEKMTSLHEAVTTEDIRAVLVAA